MNNSSESIEIPIDDSIVSGFGVRFAPLEPSDVWRLRVANRAYGHQTYAPSGRFSVGSRSFVLNSAGGDVIEYRPPERPDVLRVRTAAGTTLDHDPGPAMACELPPWARGFWLSGTWVGLDQQSVERDLHQAVDSGCSLAGRLIDEGWYGHRGEMFEPSAAFPDLASLVARHLSAGLEVALWVAPWVPVGTVQWGEFTRRRWFVEAEDGSPLVFPVVGDGVVTGSYIDLSKAEPAAAWTAAVAGLRSIGVRAVKLDFGEALPDDARLSGEVGSDLAPDPQRRNWFPVYAQRATRAGLGAEGFLMSRSGWTGSEQITSNWIGDQSSDGSRFAGLGSALWGLQSATASGYGSVGMDVGGYFGAPTERWMVAWQRTSLLFDFGMYHGLEERAPWRLGPAVRAEHDRCAELFELFGERRRGQVEIDTTESGQLIAQRQIGEFVVVADLARPIVFRAPPGEWADLRSGASVTGGSLHECEPGSVFVRS